jgi:hypoxanthine-guanine phosphoribosyltransferase
VATVLLFCSGSIWVLRYTRRLFIKLTRSKSRTYAQLVQSFRDAQGQPRQRTVLTLGRVDESGGTLDAVLSTLLRAKGRSGVDITTPQVRFESALALGDV